MKKKSPLFFVFIFFTQFFVAQEAPVANNDVKSTFINTPLIENAPGLLIMIQMPMEIHFQLLNF